MSTAGETFTTAGMRGSKFIGLFVTNAKNGRACHLVMKRSERWRQNFGARTTKFETILKKA
jgi:hypothetical protein